METTFPTVFDATMLRAAKSCKRKFFYEFMKNKVSSGTSPDLIAGAAWARGHEVFRKLYYSGDADFDTALVKAFIAMATEFGPEETEPEANHPKTFDRLAEALVAYYYEAYPPEFDDHAPIVVSGSPAVEFSFSVPLEDVIHPETGEPILYAGTFDMFSSYHGTFNYVFDDKTSKTMGFKWSEQWRLRSQFIGYAWGAKMHGYEVNGAWVRGTAFKKTSIDFADAPLQIPQWMIDDWYRNLVFDLNTLIEHWRNDFFPKNYDDACNAYGGCQYLNLCEMPDNQAPFFLANDFEDRFWSPVKIDTL